MPIQSQTVYVDGLEEFRAAVRKAQVENPRLLAKALKTAGVPIIAAVRVRVPHESGALARGYKVSVRRTTASIVSSTPYAGGAEWGRRGKWAGWVARYGYVPRFVWPTVEAMQEQTAAMITLGLRDVVSIYGWAH